MGKVNCKYFSFFVLLWFLSCVGTDFEPEVAPIIRIINIPDKFHATGLYNLEANYMNERGVEEDVIFDWSSSDETVFNIDQNGVGTALKEGIVTLTVRYQNHLEAISITVFASEESIRITEAPDSLSVGQSFTLRAIYTDITGASRQPNDSIIWSVNDQQVAEIDGNGTVRALWVGIAGVKVSTGDFSDSISFEVNRAATIFQEELRIVSSVPSMEVESQFQFEAQFFDSFGNLDPTIVPQWTSSTPTVISIDQNGRATALTEGTTSITASALGKTSTTEVTSYLENETTVRNGSLRGTGYNISGNFTLSLEGDQLLLNFENASIDPNAPGPYFYLSNQERSVTGGVNLGESQDGTFSINVSEISPETSINSYDYVIVWCEPFNVTLGLGSLSN